MTSKTIVIATLGAVLLMSGPALAADPASADDCSKLSFDLAKKAGAAKLAEADAAKVEEMLGRLDRQCADNKLSDAAATAKDVEAAINKK